MSKPKLQGKWKAESPARSNTGSSTIRGRISAPIPIDDEEFPIRAPGTGIATPLGGEGAERQLALPGSHHIPQHESVAVADFASLALDSMVQVPANASDEVPVQQTIQEPSAQRQSDLSTPPSITSEGKPQRKRSTFRSVLGRLFGKRRRGSRDTSLSRRSNVVRAGQHRSDPSALHANPKVPGQRSASLPINEFNRALRSHSATLDDFPTNEGGGRDSAPGEHMLPRRATTSRLFGSTSLPRLADWTGLTPRPASSHARSSQILSDLEAGESIGVAVTSGNHPKRRSRSVGQLGDASRVVQDTPRRRSDEIRYWRESYEPTMLSPMSSNKAEVEEPIVLDEPVDIADEAPQSQFNFGPMSEMAGLKITKAADLETRVSELEARLLQVERTVSQIMRLPKFESVQVPAHETPVGNQSSFVGTPTRDSGFILSSVSRQRHQAARHQIGSREPSSAIETSRSSTEDTEESIQPSFQESSPPRFISTMEHPSMASSQSSARPLSTTTTIRAHAPSSPQLPYEGHLTMDHYNSLSNMIEAEQKARQRLERLVETLKQEVRVLHSSRPATAEFSREGARMGEYSSFEHDDSSEGSVYDLPREEFQTPNEEQTFGDDPFGTRPTQHNQRTATRTLSLSQMTMGPGQGGDR